MKTIATFFFNYVQILLYIISNNNLKTFSAKKQFLLQRLSNFLSDFMVKYGYGFRKECIIYGENV